MAFGLHMMPFSSGLSKLHQTLWAYWWSKSSPSAPCLANHKQKVIQTKVINKKVIKAWGVIQTKSDCHKLIAKVLIPNTDTADIASDPILQWSRRCPSLIHMMTGCLQGNHGWIDHMFDDIFEFALNDRCQGLSMDELIHQHHIPPTCCCPWPTHHDHWCVGSTTALCFIKGNHCLSLVLADGWVAV